MSSEYIDFTTFDRVCQLIPLPLLCSRECLRRRGYAGLDGSPVKNVSRRKQFFISAQKWSDKGDAPAVRPVRARPKVCLPEATTSSGPSAFSTGTPDVMFELAYDDVDYDDGWRKDKTMGGWGDSSLKDDSLIRFRTQIFF